MCADKIIIDTDPGIDDAALLDGFHDGAEVVVGKDHVGGALGHLGSLEAHSNADIRTLQRRRVIHTVASHGDYVSVLSQQAHDILLMLRFRARKYNAVELAFKTCSLLLLRHLRKLASSKRKLRRFAHRIENANLCANRLGR